MSFSSFQFLLFFLFCKNVFEVPTSSPKRFWHFRCVKYANTPSIWSPGHSTSSLKWTEKMLLAVHMEQFRIGPWKLDSWRYKSTSSIITALCFEDFWSMFTALGRLYHMQGPGGQIPHGILPSICTTKFWNNHFHRLVCRHKSHPEILGKCIPLAEMQKIFLKPPMHDVDP
jgi:hypothetical protein